ncbi:hypothetical protein ES703_94320 [subsurface metagenome]
MLEILGLSSVVVVVVLMAVPIMLFLRDIRIILEKILKKLEAEG